MEVTILRYLIYGITLCVLGSILDHLHRKENVAKDANATEYIVKLPSLLRNVYLTMFLFGMFLFVFFLLLKAKGNPTVTDGHLWFSLGFATIGVLVMVYAVRWRIDVSGNVLSIHRLMRKTVTASFAELGEVRVGKQEDLTLYQNGKKLVTVNRLSDNYELFRRALGKYGKL